jgi:hypothetical protein
MMNLGRLRRPHRRGWAAIVCAILLLGLTTGRAAADGEDATIQSLDFDNGNAALEVIYPALQTVEREVLSRTGADASIVIDFAMLLEVAWFDAIAPYHPTAVGIYSNLGRRPASEAATNRNKNLALIYSSYRIMNKYLPEAAATWNAMLSSAGLSPDDQENTDTPIGIGNLAARHLIEARHHDGMNRLGDEGGNKYNLQRYADHTGYQPVNTAYQLNNPSRWQPNIVPNGNGTFTVQQFVTPQMGRTKTFTYDDPSQFQVPPPTDSNHRNRQAYKRQADEVLAASAALTDRQKMIAELFNDKFVSLAVLPGEAFLRAGHTDLDEFVHFIAATEIALFDSAVETWYLKRRFDAVRPFSAIRYLYGDQPLTAWGGPGKGTVHDITGKEWRSYLNTADHPEYPSGSASLCQAYAQAARRFLGTDTIQIGITRPAGSSLVEPGITPAQDITLSWNNWTDWAKDCGMSRVWAGVHFRPSIENAAYYAPQIGNLAYELVERHIKGDG